jgi:hypothetical protein
MSISLIQRWRKDHVAAWDGSPWLEGGDRGSLGGVLSQAETGVRLVTVESAVLGGEAVKRSTSQLAASLSAHLWRHVRVRNPF